MQMDKFYRVREAMESFTVVPASEPLLAKLPEVSKVIAELKEVKAAGPNVE